MKSGRILLTLAREALRAVASPFRFLLYLVRRRHWRTRVEAALRAPLPEQQHLDDGLPIPESTPHLFISAGEASGEGHALRLMTALHAQGLRPRWTCFGSRTMAAAGARLLYPLADTALMGFLPVFRNMGGICRAVSLFEALLREDPPDAVVLVDYPGLHMVLGEAARRRNIPVLHYIAPQYWAWAPWRIHRYRRCVDRSLCILPFEVTYFDRAGIRSTYVGHPLVDEVPQAAPDDERGRILCLLPGSRSKEIALNLPGMLEVAAKLRDSEPELRVVVAHRDPRRAEQVREILGKHGVGLAEVHVGPPGPWLAAARVALAKSGTGSLEACLHGTPTVVVYKLRESFTLAIYSLLLCVPWFASANLLSGRRIVPEFAFANRAGWDEVAEAVRELFVDGPARSRARRDLAELRERLGGPGASHRAALALRGFLHERGAKGRR